MPQQNPPKEKLSNIPPETEAVSYSSANELLAQKETPPQAPVAEHLPATIPEQGAEIILPKEQITPPETGEGFLDETITGMKKILKRPKKQKPTTIPQVRDEITVTVENIMSEGLKEAFQELSITEQQQFKIKGEETALKIRDLLKATHVKVKKIFQLILDWLKMLPGINRFFLEQEAKIKADKIIALKQIHSNKE